MPRWGLLDHDYNKSVAYRKESPVNAGWLRKASLDEAKAELAAARQQMVDGLRAKLDDTLQVCVRAPARVRVF